MTGVYEIRPNEYGFWPLGLNVTQVGPMTENRMIPSYAEAATEQRNPKVPDTLPASDDQQAVTVRFSYPAQPQSSRRGTLLVDGRPTDFVVEYDRAGRVWRLSGSAGDTPNSGEKADTASGFVTGSCPDLVGEVRRLRAWQCSALSVLAEWDQVWESLGKPGRLGDSIAVASRKEIERRKWPERAGQ